MERAANLIRKIDLVGFQLRPTFNHSNRIKTVLGGSLSVVLVSLLFFGLVYFGTEMVTRSSPTISASKMKVDDVKVTFSDIPLFISAYDARRRNITRDPEFKRNISIVADFIRFDETEQEAGFKMSSYRGNFVDCTADLLKEEYFEQALSSGYDPATSLCLDYKNMLDSKGNLYQGEVYIRNEYHSINSGMLSIKVFTCDEQADPGCRAFLNKKGRFWLNAYVPDNYEEASKYDNPVKKNFSLINYAVTQNFLAQKKIEFEVNELVTDNGIVLENIETEPFLAVNSVEFSLESFMESQRIVYKLIISIKQIKNTTSRKYLKLQELMANLGGFIKASFYLATAICHTYSEFVLYSEINTLVFQVNSTGVAKNNLVAPKETSKVQICPKPTKNSKTLPKVNFLGYIKAFFQSKTTNKGKIDRIMAFRFLELTYIIKQMTKIEEIKAEPLTTYFHFEAETLIK